MTSSQTCIELPYGDRRVTVHLPPANLLGVFASAVLLYGMSLLYGLAGSTRLSDIAAVVNLDGDKVALQVLAVVFVIVGFAFKVSAVPFHTWAPDTYQGAPTAVTAFLSVASKAAGLSKRSG